MSASKIVLRILSISLSALSLILVIFLLYKVGLSAYDFGYRVFTEKPMTVKPGRDVSVEVKKQMSGMDIGRMLEEKRLIDSGTLFYIQLNLSSNAKAIKPGIYTLNTSQTSQEMMEVMSKEKEEISEEKTDNDNQKNK